MGLSYQGHSAQKYSIEIEYLKEPSAWRVYSAKEAKVTVKNSNDLREKVWRADLYEKFVLGKDSIEIVTQKGNIRTGEKVSVGVFNLPFKRTIDKKKNQEILQLNSQTLESFSMEEKAKIKEYLTFLLDKTLDGNAHNWAELEKFKCLRQRDLRLPINCKIEFVKLFQ